MWPCIVINFLKYNQLDALIFQIYFWNQTLHVSDSSSVHHQKFFYCTHSNGIFYTGLLTAASRIRVALVPSWSFLQLSANLYNIYHWMCVQWKSPDDGQRNCPKHVRFHSKKWIWEISASNLFYCEKFIVPNTLKLFPQSLESAHILFILL